MSSSTAHLLVLTSLGNSSSHFFASEEGEGSGRLHRAHQLRSPSSDTNDMFCDAHGRDSREENKKWTHASSGDAMI